MALPRFLGFLVVIGCSAFNAAASVQGAASLDCALNGVKLTDGSCKCDPAWEGSQCERFAFVPGTDETDINSPWAAVDLETSTWGMGTLQKPIDGKQHMFGMELTGSCGIGAWQTNSQVVHWVSDAPEPGAWTRKEVVLPAQATCPSAAVSPNGALIMTLLGGEQRTSKQRTPQFYPDGDPSNHKFCHNGSTPCGFSKHGCSNTSVGEGILVIIEELGNQNEYAADNNSIVSNTMSNGGGSNGGGSIDCVHCKTEDCKDHCTFSMYVSPTGVGGPWELTSAVIQLSPEYNPTGFKGTFSISAPYVSPNGTAHIVLQTAEFPDWYPANLTANNIGAVLRAETWEGPYTVVARGACGAGEDMFIWQDQRGHFHCIWHNTGETSKNHGPHQDGAHSFSVDGRDPWYCVDGAGGHGMCTADTPAPYNTTLAM